MTEILKAIENHQPRIPNFRLTDLKVIDENLAVSITSDGEVYHIYYLRNGELQFTTSNKFVFDAVNKYHKS